VICVTVPVPFTSVPSSINEGLILDQIPEEGGGIPSSLVALPVLMSMRALAKNLTIVGPPGSGKGFYGQPLASFLGVPLWTASSILRERSNAGPGGLDLTSGRLVDCGLVSSTLRSFLVAKGSSGFILDGFPRTRLQIELMLEAWPTSHQVHFCVQLDIPDEVCQQKVLGRRHCRVCNRYINLANVQDLGFDLPPQIPSRTANGCTCDPATDWITREDDTLDTVQRRLQLYRENEAPILDFYRRSGRLIKLKPYRGEKDIPELQLSVEGWLNSFEFPT
jgi:adenylate kinase